MAFDVTKPADTQTIAAGPADIRENFRALRDDKIVNAQKLMDLSPGNASGNIPVANGNLCLNLNAEKLGGNTANAFASNSHSHGVVTNSSNGLMSNTDKVKLDGIAAGAEVNQNAFSKILVGTTTIQADGPTDTLELVAGTNIAITPDMTNDRVTFAISGTVADADTVDGFHADALLRKMTMPATNDLNDFLDLNAFLTYDTGAGAVSNSPLGNLAAGSGQVFVVENFGTSPIRICQRCIFFYPLNTIGVYLRNRTDSTWGAWRQLPTVDGNIATASKLQTPKKINGVSFDGSADITITAAANGGTAAVCSGNAATASKLQTARGITLTGEATGSLTFDGSANVVMTTTIPSLVSHGKKIYTSNGTFYVPDRVTEVWVTMAGGGGGNGYYHGYEWVYPDYVDRYYSYVGGRGASCFMRPVAVTPGTSIDVIVGTSGANGTVATGLGRKSGSNGKGGGVSSFGNLLSCSGGGAGMGTTATNGTTASPQEITLSWGSAATSGIVIVEW